MNDAPGKKPQRDEIGTMVCPKPSSCSRPHVYDGVAIVHMRNRKWRKYNEHLAKLARARDEERMRGE